MYILITKLNKIQYKKNFFRFIAFNFIQDHFELLTYCFQGSSETQACGKYSNKTFLNEENSIKKLKLWSALHFISWAEWNRVRKVAFLQHVHEVRKVVGRCFCGTSVILQLHFLTPCDHSSLFQSSRYDMIQKTAESSTYQNARSQQNGKS